MLLLVVVATACGSAADKPAATVNGVDIAVADVTALRTSYGDDAVLAADFRDDLVRLIFQEAIAQGLSTEFDISVPEDALERRIQEFNDFIAENGITIGDGLGVPDATEELLRREALTFELRLAAIDELIAETDVLDEVLADPVAITEVCVRHILVDSQGGAQDVIARLDAGEDFAAVATEVSLDTSPGGDLGCALASRYVPEFADASIVAPIGSLFGPIQTDFGFHVLIVDDRTAPTAAEIEADPLAYLPQDLAQNLWQDWFNETIAAAEIDIDSSVGTWNAEATAINPPAG